MIVTVKIKPWLKEFLECRFGDPVQASKQNLVGVLIAPLVDYTPGDYQHEVFTEAESLKIEIPRDLAVRAARSDNGNIYVTRENQQRFEAGVAVVFKDQLFFYLDDKIRYEGKERSSNMKDCIYQFCIDNKIKFDAVSYENLKKMYYRYRKRQENANKRGRIMSLVCPLIF